MVKKQMQQEVEKLGLALYSDGGQDEYERRVMDIEQKSIKNPSINPIKNPQKKSLYVPTCVPPNSSSTFPPNPLDRMSILDLPPSMLSWGKFMEKSE